MNEKNTKHILSIMVDNEPGVLARVVGLFLVEVITLKVCQFQKLILISFYQELQ